MPRAKRCSLQFASLFCGCGGFDLGFIRAGYRCAAAFDNNPGVVAVHRRNLKSPAEVCDLSNGSAWPGTLRGIDVLLAGPPCQGFSTAGKRELDDPRNHLLVRVGEIALAVSPTVLIVENVTGVAKGEHKRYWVALHTLLRAGGYRTVDLKCDMAQIGVAQTRVRMVMVAWNNGRSFEPALPERPGRTLRDALAGIAPDTPNHEVKLLDPHRDLAKIARHIGPGQKLCNVRNGPRAVHTWEIPEVFGKVTKREVVVLERLLRLRRRLRLRDCGDADPVSARDLAREVGHAVRPDLEALLAKGYVRKIDGRYELKHTFNGKVRRLEWDAPSYTVDTRFTDPRYFLHPDEDRGFTIREAARIQGFPDTFVFDGSERAQVRMIGNAVPAPLAQEIALLAREII